MQFIVKLCPGYFCRRNYLSTQMLLRCINSHSSGSRKGQERICFPSARSQNCFLESSSPHLEKTSVVQVTDWYLCPYGFSCPALAVQGKLLLRAYWQGIRIGTGLDWCLCAMGRKQARTESCGQDQEGEAYFPHWCQGKGKDSKLRAGIASGVPEEL